MKRRCFLLLRKAHDSSSPRQPPKKSFSWEEKIFFSFSKGKTAIAFKKTFVYSEGRQTEKVATL
jgi:hypothetical protein